MAGRRLILIALWFFFYSSLALITPPLLDDADSVHAEVARGMLLRNDWVTLYANGIRYLEKAPLLYWSMATSFKLFGPQTVAARKAEQRVGQSQKLLADGLISKVELEKSESALADANLVTRD